MKTLPSLRTSSLLLFALLGVSVSFALQAPSAASGGAASSGTSGSGTVSGTTGTGGTSGSTSGSMSGGTSTPTQPGLPTQPGVPSQPVVPDQPGLPVQPNPNLPQDPTVGATTTTTTTTTTDGTTVNGTTVNGTTVNGTTVNGTTVNGTTTGTNSDTRIVGGTVVGGSILDTQGATQKIESTTFVTRDQALRQVERSSTLGAGYISMIERNTGTLTGEARTRVNDAIRRANAARTELDKSISLARSSNERRWKDARAELLERYRAYDQALADARAVAIEAGAQVDAQAGTTSNTGM